MTRLSSDTLTSFMFLDGLQIYDEAEIDRICEVHDITSDDDRAALWRVLETAGQRLKDQQRLQIKRAQLSKLKQELRLGLRLSSQLSEHLPDGQQLQNDQPSIGLNRYHLSALREGDRTVASRSEEAKRFRLEDAADFLDYLTEVYDAALNACAAGGLASGQNDPEALWRADVKAFYTRTLARAWVTRTADQGERFLIDCRMALEQLADQDEEGPDLAMISDGQDQTRSEI